MHYMLSSIKSVFNVLFKYVAVMFYSDFCCTKCVQSLSNKYDLKAYINQDIGLESGFWVVRRPLVGIMVTQNHKSLMISALDIKNSAL